MFTLKNSNLGLRLDMDQLLGQQTGQAVSYTSSKSSKEIMIMTSYPPRECGIATYSRDLFKSIENKFEDHYSISVCAIETNTDKHSYTAPVKYILNTDSTESYAELGNKVRMNANIEIIVLQHEFGFFNSNPDAIVKFLEDSRKAVVIVFHTVLPKPNNAEKKYLEGLAKCAKSIIVMTQDSARILIEDYHISSSLIRVIPHGTHLVMHAEKDLLKLKHGLKGKTVLATFGLISPGKSIETSILALPKIIEKNPDVVFLVLGITHPTLLKSEGEKYRTMLQDLVVEMKLEKHVVFINRFLELQELLEYLQLTDVYLFTSKDPHQSVSGTFSYAISCGCAVISTPIPHAREVLSSDAGIIVDFENPAQLADAALQLLNNEELRSNMASNGLHQIAATAWENSALAYMSLFQKLAPQKTALQYKWPEMNLAHIKKLTTDFGMIQFSKINQPDLGTGYTLDDNARALIAMCQHYKITEEISDLTFIKKYLDFIEYCQQKDSCFLNYVDIEKRFTSQNGETNLADSNGRAIWALGYVISNKSILPTNITLQAELLFHKALLHAERIHSTRAMAFVIKGLQYYLTATPDIAYVNLIKRLANRMVQMYKHERRDDWEWFEGYLTYANSLLPEALLCAWIATGEPVYKDIAKTTFDFLLSKTFRSNGLFVISNKNWMHRGVVEKVQSVGGEQPIDVAYSVIALSRFSKVFSDAKYMEYMNMAFNWFLGQNHLGKIVYNPCTGGCYDGLEEHGVNLNQGAESTVSYLMARQTMQEAKLFSLADVKEKEMASPYKDEPYMAFAAHL